MICTSPADQCVKYPNLGSNGFFLTVQSVGRGHVGGGPVSCICHLDIYNPGQRADCTISIRYPGGDLNEPQPLILRRNDSYTSFLYPEGDDEILRIYAGDSIYLACPGKNNYLNNPLWGVEAEATCVRDKLFRVKNGLYEFSTLACAKSPMDSAKKLKTTAKTIMTKNSVCKHTSINIGFNVGNTFIRTIEICRDDSRYSTYYAKSRITSHIGNLQKSYPRPQFKQGTFYKGINVDNLYQFNTQMIMLARILGSAELAEERLQKSVQYLARGHLVPKTDFVYGSQQNSTFWFVNVAPQWQTFNNGNWKWLENSVRDFVSKRRLELDVYTGIYDRMTMEDIHGVQQPIYLVPERQALLVPKYFWKIVHDPLSNKGVAFVGLNDPFIQSITDNLKICTDITDQIDWLKWSPKNITAGVSYACTVNELQNRVPEVPVLHVTGLLK